MIENIRKTSLINKVNRDNILLVCIFSIFFCFVILNCFYTLSYLIDSLEHIQASWLVSIGKIPYRDFFEHHNPLIWYLLAPIVKVLEYNLSVVYICRIIAVLGYFSCFLILYHIISKHLANKQIALYTMLYIMLLPLGTVIIDIRPDIFMLMCQLLSLNYLYNYLDSKRRKDLIVSYVMISFSFLFLQKSLFFIFCFGLGSLYLLYKKSLKFKDCLIAGSVALIPLLMFAIYLYVTDSWKEYCFYNYPFNLQLIKYYGNVNYYTDNFDVWLFISFLVFIRLCPKNDKYIFLAVIVFGQVISLINFAPYSHYYVPCLLFCAVTMGYCLQKLVSFKSYMLYVIYAAILFFSASGLLKNNNQYSTELLEYIKYSIQPRNEVLNLGDGCIYCQPVGYYWFGFGNVVVIDDVFNFRNINLNQIISSQKADYIYIYKGRNHIYDNQNRFNILLNKMIIKAAVNSKKSEEYISKIKKVEFDYWNIDYDELTRYYVKVKELTDKEIWKSKNI